MKKVLIALLVSGLLVGCASIVSKSKYPISVNSNPSGSKITITDDSGMSVYEGTTPAVVKLKSGKGYFKKATYQVRFEMEGYGARIMPITHKLDGWYFGNLLFGGFIGLLIVDPISGAMFKPETDYVSVNLDQNSSTSLKIYNFNDLSEEEKSHLVRIN
jgi:hypothetical protein